MIWAVNNIVFPNFDLKITINTYKIRFGQKLRMLPSIAVMNNPKAGYRPAHYLFFPLPSGLQE